MKVYLKESSVYNIFWGIQTNSFFSDASNKDKKKLRSELKAMYFCSKSSERFSIHRCNISTLALSLSISLKNCFVDVSDLISCSILFA